MGDLPPRVQERLEQLSRKLESELPTRIEEIRELFGSARAGKGPALRELRNRVHQLAGTAATFGLDSVTIDAREAEKHISHDLESGTKRISELTVSSVETFVEKYGGGTDTTHAAGPGSRERVIMALAEAGNPLSEMEDQLGVFGYAVRYTVTLEDVGGCVENGTNGDGCTNVVVFADLSFFAGKPERLKELKDLRERFPERIHLVLVAENHDFETRLKSVRYGADAFFQSPVELTQLVDKFEDMLSEQMSEPYHILVIDDDPEQVSSTALVLQEAGMITSVVSDPEYLFEIMVEYKPELILMDMYMPKCSGMELASIIRQNDSFVSIPIVFYSVERDQEKQLEAIRCGGDDFLTKPIDPEHLVTSVRIRAARTRAMRFFMERDSLTGLLNHTNIKTRLNSEIDRARRIGTQLAFVMIDIDRFKGVNDTHGHLTGDRVLRSLARLLQERLRRTDLIGRYGGEEFAVVLFNTDADRAVTVMNEVRERFSRIRQNSGTAEFSVTLSAGISVYPDYASAAELNEAADTALYDAKNRGRNRVILAGT